MRGSFGLEGKRILVTASSSGIGFGAAKAFLEEGARVVINSSNHQRLSAAARELHTLGEVHPVLADLTRKKDLDRLVAESRRHLGGRTSASTERASPTEALAEYIVVRAVNANKFTEVSFEEAAFTEPLACVLNGNRRSQVRLGDRAAIIGCGQIGLMHMQIAKLKGAETIMIDLKEDRLLFAKKLGANHVINPSEGDVVAKIKEITDGYEADKVIVAIGNSYAIEIGMQIVGKMGSVNMFASTNPPVKISVDPNLIHHNEVSLIGSYDKTTHDLRQATELIDSGKIDVKSLITHEFDLEHTEDALRVVEKGIGIKTVVKPNKE